MAEHNFMKPLLLFLATLTTLVLPARADLLDRLGLRGTKSGSNQTTGLALNSLSQDQMIAGLKEALAQGVQNAVGQLGHEGGFMNNLNVRIPLPEKLRSAETTLRALKQDKVADDFVRSMNRAAEKAVPEAAAVFSDAVKQMTIADARSILSGTNNAATQYFRRTTETNLFARFLPVVTNATEQVGVTAAYKGMMAQVGGSGTLGGLLGGTGWLKAEDLDLDRYVTGKALDGLFTVIAEEEKRIRENPAARTTALLQKVFGAAAK